jgi:TfoX/Sxy family transcriptional regulator of competence genes
MAYDEDLADRIRVAIQTVIQAGDGVIEKRMFGGLAFLVNGNMAVSASSRGGLLLRVDPEDSETFLAEQHVEPFEMRGSSMHGWLRVDPAGLDSDEVLQRWVDVGVARARALPAK